MKKKLMIGIAAIALVLVVGVVGVLAVATQNAAASTTLNFVATDFSGNISIGITNGGVGVADISKASGTQASPLSINIAHDGANQTLEITDIALEPSKSVVYTFTTTSNGTPFNYSFAATTAKGAPTNVTITYLHKVGANNFTTGATAASASTSNVAVGTAVVSTITVSIDNVGYPSGVTFDFAITCTDAS